MAELNDEEHELILDNPEADKFIAEQAVARAVAGGMDRAEAEKLYGYKPRPAPLDTEDMNRIAKEVILNVPPAREDTEAMAEFRRNVTDDVARQREKDPNTIFELVRE
jgi:hypothetical protein